MSRIKLSKTLQSANLQARGVLALMQKNIELMHQADARIVYEARSPKEAAQLFLKSGRPIMGSSTKVELGEGFGYMTSVLYISPAKLAGYEVCAGRSAACTKSCLSHKSGNLVFHQAGAVFKSWLAKYYPSDFNAAVQAELTKEKNKADRLGFKMAVRLNGTSDKVWSELWAWAQAQDIRCYEYTKLRGMLSRTDGVHRTYSISEDIESFNTGMAFVKAGFNASIVLPSRAADKALAIEALASYVTIEDGDQHDLRFLDAAGSVAYLKAKGIPSDDPLVFDAMKIHRYARACGL